jgi:hypothetical protein
MLRLMRDYEPRDPVGDELVLAILAEIEEDERLSELVGVDLAPVGPDPSHAPSVLPSLEDWLRRAEEAYRFLEAARLREVDAR